MNSPSQLGIIVGALVLLQILLAASRPMLFELIDPRNPWGMGFVGGVGAVSCLLLLIAFQRFQPRTVAGRIACAILWLLTAIFVVAVVLMFFGPGGHPPLGVLLWGLAAFAGRLLVPAALIAVVVASGMSESRRYLALALVWLTLLDVAGIGAEPWRWPHSVWKLVS